MDMVHSLQLEISGADISFAAPLSFDVQIVKGTVTVGDMFKLYKYENLVYTMRLSGDDIQKYLEFSYSGWFKTLKGTDDIMLKFRKGNDRKALATKGKILLMNQPYSFDSAAGVEYIVDLSKPEGSRILIKGFSDGRPINKNNIYKVAVDSHQGNGGGANFTEGAEIKKKNLKASAVSSTDKELRCFILQSIKSKGTIYPVPIKSWKIVPYRWVKKRSPGSIYYYLGIVNKYLCKYF